MLKTILAISGKPGLYKLISQAATSAKPGSVTSTVPSAMRRAP